MMYNHLLCAMDGRKEHKCIAEDSPDSDLGLLVWPADFQLDAESTRLLVADFEEWARERGLRYSIQEGHRC